MGELPKGVSRRTENIAAFFSEGGAEGTVSEDITLSLWQKFVFLASLAAACGLTRLPVGPLRDSSLGRRLLQRAVGEAVAAGRSRGVPLPENEEGRVLSLINSLPPTMQPSLLLDLLAGTPTEVAVLSGAIARFAEESKLETPIHDLAAIALARQ
ncbi:MAG: hypothetical protein PVSMB1_14600 [Gemmatimonadaceae bacterium]